jgi:hypothetical protein
MAILQKTAAGQSNGHIQTDSCPSSAACTPNVTPVHKPQQNGINNVVNNNNKRNKKEQ